MSKKSAVSILALLLVVPSVCCLAATDTNGDGSICALVPVAMSATARVNGANGSVWAMELWLNNRSSTSILSLQGPGCAITPCDAGIAVGFLGQVRAITTGAGDGALLYLPAASEGQVDLSARLLEISKRAQPTGVDIPIIREGDFFTEPVALIAVPNAQTIRATLRVYDPFISNTRFKVDVLDMTGVVLTSMYVSPSAESAGGGPVAWRYPAWPASAAIYDLGGSVAALRSLDRYTIVVSPEVPGTNFWTFLSVTDNETQHVLFVTRN